MEWLTCKSRMFVLSLHEREYSHMAAPCDSPPKKRMFDCYTYVYLNHRRKKIKKDNIELSLLHTLILCRKPEFIWKIIPLALSNLSYVKFEDSNDIKNVPLKELREGRGGEGGRYTKWKEQGEEGESSERRSTLLFRMQEESIRMVNDSCPLITFIAAHWRKSPHVCVCVCANTV